MQELPRSKRVAELVPALFVSGPSVHESVQGGSCRGSGPGDVRNGRGIAACSLAPPGVRPLPPQFQACCPSAGGVEGATLSSFPSFTCSGEENQGTQAVGWAGRAVVRLSLEGAGRCGAVGQPFFSPISFASRDHAHLHHLPSDGTNRSHMESPSSDVPSTATKRLRAAAISRAEPQDRS